MNAGGNLQPRTRVEDKPTTYSKSVSAPLRRRRDWRLSRCHLCRFCRPPCHLLPHPCRDLAAFTTLAQLATLASPLKSAISEEDTRSKIKKRQKRQCSPSQSTLPASA